MNKLGGNNMDLFKIQHDLIANRTGDAWFSVPTDGPVFRERWDYGTGPDGHFVTVMTEHSSQAVLREEPLLTLSWGMDVDDDRRSRKFDWAEDNFPDGNVHVFWADFFWAGALIDRLTLIAVDGHRGVIPFPDVYGKVSTYELAVACVIHDLGSYHDNYNPVDVIRRLGFAEQRDSSRGGAGS